MLRLALIAALTTAAIAGGAGGARHLTFIRSEPADKAVLDSAPAEIRLFFNQKPLLAKTVISVADSSGHAVALDKPALAPADSAPVVAHVPTKLARGTYRVAWESAASDGHSAKGTFRFTVK